MLIHAYFGEIDQFQVRIYIHSLAIPIISGHIPSQRLSFNIVVLECEQFIPTLRCRLQLEGRGYNEFCAYQKWQFYGDVSW